MENKRGKKTTQKQYEIMINFIERHKDMINGKLSNKFTAKDRDDHWEELATILNADGVGPQKTAMKWKKTWIDIKSEAKAKGAEIIKHRKKTGGGPAIESLPPIMEKINMLVDPVLITGDDGVEETGRGEEELNRIDSQEPELILGIPEPSTSNSMTDQVTEIASTPNILECFRRANYSSRGPKRKVSAHGFNTLLETEAEKVKALTAISLEMAKANELKNEQNALYKERTDVMINATNAFLTLANAFLEK